MTKKQRVHLELLVFNDPLMTQKSHNHFSQVIAEKFKDLDSIELADMYADNGFLKTFLEFLKEQHWIKTHSDQKLKLLFEEFVQPYLAVEFKSREYLHEFMKHLEVQNIKKLGQQVGYIEEAILLAIKERSSLDKINFSRQVLVEIQKIYLIEHFLTLDKKQKNLPMELSLYRTFDSIDEMFNLTYTEDLGMKTNMRTGERLYEGAGVGVQSGYSNLLTALYFLSPEPGARIIDLGSGYGRLGFVVGLMRPDMDFIGYEFVKHRVDISNKTVSEMQLGEHVHFYEQDLSNKHFKIPEAEIYYLYDPFCEETYKYVLSQLVEISRKQKICIVTKGNARPWLMEVAEQNHWPDCQQLDSGNLCLFASR
jgi:hypothetical protein